VLHALAQRKSRRVEENLKILNLCAESGACSEAKTKTEPKQAAVRRGCQGQEERRKEEGSQGRVLLY